LTIVSNATPIIYLGKIGKLFLLKQLYEHVHIPRTVWEELVRPLTEAWVEVPEDVPEIINAYSERWLTPKHLDQKHQELSEKLVTYGIHKSQADAIALTIQLKADFFLTNDEVAREAALKHKAKTRWLTEVLLDALKSGLIKHPEDFDEILDKLVAKGLWIRKTLIQAAKNKARKVGT